MNRATTEQPLPQEGQQSVHAELVARFGEDNPVVRDIVLRAEKAKEKYKLSKIGLYTFNGRDALLDAYQEFCDLIIYMLQFEIEERVRFQQGLSDDMQVTDGYVRHLLGEATVIREHLVERGNFE